MLSTLRGNKNMALSRKEIREELKRFKELPESEFALLKKYLALHRSSAQKRKNITFPESMANVHAFFDCIKKYNFSSRLFAKIWDTSYSSGLFDREFYIRNNPDVAESGCDPLDHYLIVGWKENRAPFARWNVYEELYWQTHSEIAQNVPFDFYIKHGTYPYKNVKVISFFAGFPMNSKEQKKYRDNYLHIKNSGLFDEKFYLSNNPDVIDNGCNPLDHYMLIGRQENRSPFASWSADEELYWQTHSETAENQPLDLYIKHGKTPYKNEKVISFFAGFPMNSKEQKKYKDNYLYIKNSGLFDEKFYLSNNPDVIDNGCDPLDHYMLIGRQENRSPFDKWNGFAEFYWQTHSETAENQPLDLYIKHGTTSYKNEKIISFFAGFPMNSKEQKKYKDNYLHIKNSGLFDEKFYLSNNPDVIDNGCDPLDHYMLIGRQENRSPFASWSADEELYWQTHSETAENQPLDLYIKHGKTPYKNEKVISFFAGFPMNSKEQKKYRDNYLHIKNSGLFNEKFYLNNNPDVIDNGCDPLDHYLLIGWQEERSPFASWSAEEELYWQAHSENAEKRPLDLYLKHGAYDRKFLPAIKYFVNSSLFNRDSINSFRKEYNIICKSGLFDGKFYLKNNPDTARTGCEPLDHYLLTDERQRQLPAENIPASFKIFMEDICGETNPLRTAEYFKFASDRSFIEVLDKLIANDRLGILEYVFNKRIYAERNPDVVRAMPGHEFLHYTQSGWKENRVASLHCHTEAYRNYMKEQNIDLHTNLLFSFVKSGADYELLKKINDFSDTQEKLIQDRMKKFFDPDFYWVDSKDVRNLFIDPYEHYNKFGWQEYRDPCKDFSSSEYVFYMKHFLHKKPSNPLRCFAERGASDAELLNAKGFFAEKKTESLGRLNVEKKLLRDVRCSSSFSGNKNPKIAVHLHLFYLDLTESIAEYLNYIPLKFDLYVSIPENKSDENVREIFANRIQHLDHLYIEKTPNIGRDVAPLIVTFGKKLLNYDYICHIHSKKSLHGGDAVSQWRDFIMEHLFPKEDGVRKILSMLDSDSKVIYPPAGEGIHFDCAGWGNNFDISREIAQRYWNNDLSDYPVVEFSMGTMFWARAKAVEKFLTLPLSYDDFPPEPLPTDMTIAHALERLLLVSAADSPGKATCICLTDEDLDTGLRMQKKLQKSTDFLKKLYGENFKYPLDIVTSELLKNISSGTKTGNFPEPAPVTILIPIYNGLNHLKKLIPSLLAHTDNRHKIIFADDASPDREIIPYLEKICEMYPNCTLLQSKVNRGFLPNINEASKHCEGDFILLNTDTVVVPNWLPRLMAPLYENEFAASVTPFSNAASIFSFPEIDSNNTPFSETFDAGEIDFAFKKFNLPEPLDTVVGVGFCMAVRKKVWDEIGPFDEKSFGKGYGEEVDWCLRAARAGYKHYFAYNLFIPHLHGGSFSSAEKKKLSEDHEKIIRARYPEFQTGLEKFDRCNRSILSAVRFSALCKILKNAKKSLTLMISLNWGGGAQLFADKHIRQLNEEGKNVLVLYPVGKSRILAHFHCRGTRFPFFIDSLDILCESFMPDIEKILLNSFAGWNLIENTRHCSNEFHKKLLEKIVKIKQFHEAQLTFFMHDFFTVCPFFNLSLSKTFKYCKPGPDVSECSKCLNTLSPYIGYQAPPDTDMKEWRDIFRSFLKKYADEIIFFSENTREIIETIWDEPLRDDKYKVIPHKPLETLEKVIPHKGDKITIASIGTLTPFKGGHIIIELARLIKKRNLNIDIVIIGNVIQEKPLPPWIKVHGAFAHNELPELMKRYKINMGFLASICPETFSFVRQEFMQMDIPTVCFDLGAPRDYIKNWDRGMIIPEITAESALETIQKLYNKVYNK